ncbi:MAG: YdcF family protein [gamma proteobacterium symbiont of Phacoides pectinatus]
MLDQELVWILKTLATPPGALILLGLLGLLSARRRSGRLLLWLTLLALYLLSTPYVSGLLMQPLQAHAPWRPARTHSEPPQAIVVLGGGRRINAPEYGADTLGPLALERVRYAAWLARRSGLAVVPSGGSPRRAGAAEARIMRHVMEEEFGVRVLASEETSRTTWENAALTRPLLRQHGVERVLLVTHAWHMPRALAAFTHQGIQATPAPMGFSRPVSGAAVWDWLPRADALEESARAVHEQLGRLWYRLRRAMA